jgi:amidase
VTLAALAYLSLTELAARLRSRELSPVEVTTALLERIARLDPELHAFACVLPDAALEAARRAEAELGRGEARGPLHGVPVAVKDLCAMKGVPTAAGTRVLAERRPDHTATVVERLEAAGAVVLGKLQLTEGAYGWHHPQVTPPVNPWSAAHWTGVSSSGSGAATAAGLCYGSLGSDTGGSIRFPSACCSLVGIKPSYGRVSRFGVFPLAHSLDHVGPMTRTVADAAAMLGVLAGHDPRDPTSLRAPVPDYTAALAGDLRGLRIGVDNAYYTAGVSPVVAEVAFAALECFRALGADVGEIRVPNVDPLLRAWTSVTAVECALAHADTFPARADEYGPELRALLEFAPSVSGADYARAEQERIRFRAALEDVFESVDLILVPAMPTPPPTAADAIAGNPAAGEDIGNLLQFTAPFDFSGNPTISLPGGFGADGLPLGFQLIGRHLDEAALCRAGHAYQGATDWHDRHPPTSP